MRLSAAQPIGQGGPGVDVADKGGYEWEGYRDKGEYDRANGD